MPTSVSKVSAATGLLYVYEHPAADEVRYTSGEPATGPEDPWYLTAIDARTGRRAWSALTGVGLGYNNNYAPITFGPDGTAYVGVLGGLVAVRDTPKPDTSSPLAGGVVAHDVPTPDAAPPGRPPTRSSSGAPGPVTTPPWRSCCSVTGPWSGPGPAPTSWSAPTRTTWRRRR